MPIQKPTILFVPGAWHYPAGFDTIRAALEKLSYPTAAVALPSIGHSTPSSVTILDDSTVIRAAVEELVDAGKQIVLVVHSYGGVCGGNAVEDLGYAERRRVGKEGGIINFVYMCAFALPMGVSLLDALGGVPLPWMDFQVCCNPLSFSIPGLSNTRQGDVCHAKTPEEIFYNDMSAEEQAKWAAQLSHTSAAVFSGKSTYEPAKHMPCTYILCEEDKAIPFQLQQGIAASLGSDATTFTIEASHSPFLSTPDKLAEGIELAVSVGLEKSK